MFESRVRMQRREEAAARRWWLRKWHRCRLCSPDENSVTVKVRGYAWDAHQLNHRVYRALGGEQEWIEVLRSNARRFSESGKRNLEKAHMRRRDAQQCKIYSSCSGESPRVVAAWLKRKFPYDRGAFKRKVEWVALQRFGAFVVVAGRLPFNHDRQWHGLPQWPSRMLREYAARMVGKSNSDITVLFGCFLGHKEKQILRSRFGNPEVVLKHVVHGPRDPFQFIVYTARNCRPKRSFSRGAA